jgi:hypothetical protein
MIGITFCINLKGKGKYLRITEKRKKSVKEILYFIGETQKSYINQKTVIWEEYAYKSIMEHVKKRKTSR